MPFRLVNAPTVFIDLMQKLFWNYLYWFVVEFTDSIIVHMKSCEEHLDHLCMVLDVLREKKLYAKLKKCKFWLEKVSFLGHVVFYFILIFILTTTQIKYSTRI
jgi:hypothetical protein